MSSDDQSACRRLASHRCEVVAIAAVDEGGVIGAEGGLPWHLPADLQHFKRQSQGESVVIGRRTYESFGGPLPDREHLVLTRQEDYGEEGIEVGRSMADVADWVDDKELDRLIVCGGATIYEALLPACDAMILTVVHGRFEGDTYFPGFEAREWEVEKVERHEADDRHEVAMSFVWLRAKSQGLKAVKERFEVSSLSLD